MGQAVTRQTPAQTEAQVQVRRAMGRRVRRALRIRRQISSPDCEFNCN